MTNMLQNEYHPDYVSAPGETLLETLDTIGMSQAELAKRMGRPVKTINEIIQKKAAITAETALQLEQVLHIPASFWLKLERHYRESLARLADPRCRFYTEWRQLHVQGCGRQACDAGYYRPPCIALWNLSADECVRLQRQPGCQRSVHQYQSHRDRFHADLY